MRVLTIDQEERLERLMAIDGRMRLAICDANHARQADRAKILGNRRFHVRCEIEAIKSPARPSPDHWER